MNKKLLLIIIICALTTPQMVAYASVINAIQSESLIKKNYQDSLFQPYSDSFIKPAYKYGTASFYSKNLEGTKTSTGETFRHNKLTAASNSYKLNTWLKVTNISNGKWIIVRVNDRMHPRMARKGRIVDLSYSGAKKLGFVNKGITKVKVQVVDNKKKE